MLLVVYANLVKNKIISNSDHLLDTLSILVDFKLILDLVSEALEVQRGVTLEHVHQWLSELSSKVDEVIRC